MPRFGLVLAALASLGLSACATLPPFITPEDKAVAKRLNKRLAEHSEEIAAAAKNGGLVVLSDDAATRPTVLPGNDPVTALDTAGDLPANARACFYVARPGTGARPMPLDCAGLSSAAAERRRLRQHLATIDGLLQKHNELLVALNDRATRLEKDVDALKYDIKQTDAKLSKAIEAGAATAAVVTIHNRELIEVEKALTALGRSFKAHNDLAAAGNSALEGLVASHTQSMDEFRQTLAAIKQKTDSLK